jgi:hypothetical protein
LSRLALYNVRNGVVSGSFASGLAVTRSNLIGQYLDATAAEQAVVAAAKDDYDDDDPSPAVIAEVSTIAHSITS